MTVWLFLALARAADDVDEGDDIDISNQAPKPAPDEWGFGQQKQQKLPDVDEEPAMADFAAEQRKKPPPPVRWHVDLTGKAPLTDAFDIQVAAFDDRFVVAELPVLVALDRASFLAEHPGGLVVEAEVTSGATKRVITETVTAASVYEGAPTLVFLKAGVPNPAAAGELRFLVRTQELPPAAPEAAGKPPKAPPAAAPMKERFARTTVYTRK